MEQGWIKLHRRLVDCPDIRPGWEAGLWVRILLEAGWQDDEGAVVTDWRSLAEWAGLNGKAGRVAASRALRRWQDAGMLTLHELHAGTGRKPSLLRLNISKWSEYQNSAKPVPQEFHKSSASVPQSDPASVRNSEEIGQSENGPVPQEFRKCSASVPQGSDPFLIHPARDAHGSSPAVKKEELTTHSDASCDASTDTPEVPPPPPKRAKPPAEYPAASAVKGAYPEPFEGCWSAYPRRPGNPKRAAYRAWRTRVVTDGADPAVLLSATEEYARERAGEDSTYTMQAATFYGPSGRWEPYAERARGGPEARPGASPMPTPGEAAARPSRASDALSPDERRKLRDAIDEARAHFGVDTLSPACYAEAAAFIRAHLRAPSAEHLIEWEER